MNLRVLPGPLRGTAENLISSKSCTHRALLCAALAEGPTALRRVCVCDDTRATARCLNALGADIRPDGTENGVLVTPLPLAAVPNALLDCGESASTLRFLLPVAAALGADCAFTGHERLARRPLSPLYEQLCCFGARLSPQGAFPLTCAGRLHAGAYVLSGGVSSQFVSGLLFALPLLNGSSTLTVEGPLVSAPYAEMTVQTLRAFGIEILEDRQTYAIPGNQRCRAPGALTLEGDWSAASFWLAAGALSEAGVACGPLDSLSPQGDRAVVTLLRRFGAIVETRGDCVFCRRGTLRGAALDAADTPDLVPVLAVLAGAAAGDTRIRSVTRLRLKESDRLQAVQAMLWALGVESALLAQEDTLLIHGAGRLRGGTVDCFRDHRIAMAAAVAATAAEGPVTLCGVECVSKSYPGFFRQFAALGGRAEGMTDAVSR